MLNKTDILQTITNNKVAIRKMGIIQIGLFGSYVRNEQTINSDLDLLIDFDKENKSVTNFLDFCDFMDQIFAEVKVDVVSKKGLSEFIGPYILEEVEYVEI
ncbi:nucleotidyltransferase domain-containing protein [Flavobacterium sp. SUN046]|uniref:nucleotidyltransferase family protein n=1 Tax=Flavobacterium sp. SUN046 TaxID=3002440 RepID=UPI002DBC55C2|nr:nucleotidyltransferase domain-containing protein [Flavobacterium sp. SUN046]MEC4047867.1 nucleotidyltransferase domain-containing protein [Flavobacterium sp. SUN046]